MIGVIASSFTASIAFAQTDGGMRKTTSKGTLDILLKPEWSEGGVAKFNVSFLNPGTDTVHEHQDYDFRILKGDTEVFSTAKQTGQSQIHNAGGTITVPYTFSENGDYTIQVYLAGTGISPTLPTDEEASFQIQVVPEFPAGIFAAVAALALGTVIALTRTHKFKLY